MAHGNKGCKEERYAFHESKMLLRPFSDPSILKSQAATGRRKLSRAEAALQLAKLADKPCMLPKDPLQIPMVSKRNLALPPPLYPVASRETLAPPFSLLTATTLEKINLFRGVVLCRFVAFPLAK